MATEKSYPLYRGIITSFQELAASSGWRIVAEKEIQHGYQIVVTDGITRNNVDIFPSGKIMVQGKVGSLRDEILTWRAGGKNSSEYMTVPETQPALIEIAEILPVKILSAAKEKTVEEHMTDFARVVISVAGKDDYFGPLVVSAIYIDAWIEAQLVMIGVRDTLSDEQTILAAQKIRDIAPFAVVTIGNKNYNEAFAKIRDADKLLAWSYARVIEQICEKTPCHSVVASNFGDETIIQNVLTKKNQRVTLQQSPDPNEIGVAAASLLARAEFLRRLAQLSTQVGITLPEGASNTSINIVEREIVAKNGQSVLSEIAKLHVKAHEKILNHL